MREIRTEIVINAPTSLVWEILTDFPAYPEWNPFIIRLLGQPRENALIILFARTLGLPVPIVARLVSFEKNIRLAWGGPGSSLLQRVVGAEHYFELHEVAGGGCRFVNGERFHGLLPELAWPLLSQAAPAYEAMNRALKRRAEKQR